MGSILDDEVRKFIEDFNFVGVELNPTEILIRLMIVESKLETLFSTNASVASAALKMDEDQIHEEQWKMAKDNFTSKMADFISKYGVPKNASSGDIPPATQ